MLARNKCLKVFPVLKSVHFPPCSLHPLSAEDSCPWANAWLLKSCDGIKTLFHDTGALRGWSTVSPSSTSYREKGSAQCLHAKSPGYICADTGGWLSKTGAARRKATGWCHGPHRVPLSPRVNLGRDFSTNKTLHSVRYSEGVDCVRKHTFGVRSETRL